MKRFAIYAAIVLFTTGYANAGTWTTLDFPGAINTLVYGISGKNIVGTYSDFVGNGHGFLYDGKTWITLEYPGAVSTEACGISSNNIIGWYYDGTDFYSFLYDGTTWITLNYPGATSTHAEGISGDSIVGVYSDSDYQYHSFLYDGTTWTTMDYPGAIVTHAYSISGNKIVGDYYDSNYEAHGFLYNGTTWNTLNYPVREPNHVQVHSIDGWNIVGEYTSQPLSSGLLSKGASAASKYAVSGSSIDGEYGDQPTTVGFLYDGTSWTSLNYPGAQGTVAIGISGNNILGRFSDSSGNGNNFVCYGFTACSSPIEGDVNNDCKVDFSDFAMVAVNWKVDFSDIVIMASHWLNCNLQPSSACWQ